MNMAFKFLPLFVYGKVVKGFGRGSKELGIPTANMSEDTVSLLPEEVEPGIYYGLASVDHGPVNKMVLSVGWNPFYHNEKKSMETHILYEFPEDFYGSLLQIILIGHIRPEKNFGSLDELIKAIKSDISVAKSKLTDPAYEHYFSHTFWEEKFSKESGGVFRKEFNSSDSTTSNKNDSIVNGIS